MASHVVVVDSTARRATIKTNPGKHLADILQEACAKLGADASQSSLKYKGKQLDLSCSLRLSGLSAGAKLELVQSSRSPSVVTVGLQLPQSEAGDVPNGRLTDKFPSSTTLWLVLRKFETGVAGGRAVKNITARGVPATGSDSGSGRLFYEIPVIQVLDRELSTFADLQKSLAQLGFNSGSILLRLTFRRTEEPLEAAMVKIDDYFKSIDNDVPIQEQPTPYKPTTEEPPTSISKEKGCTVSSPPPEACIADTRSSPATSPLPVRSITVFSPPTNSTPVSAQVEYNDSDYIPTIDHAQAHQHRLNMSSRPSRLPSDAEIAAKATAEEEKIARIKEVDIKIRFPDQSQILSKFGTQDTGRSLYDFVRSCMMEPFASEKFIITSPSTPIQGGNKIQSVIADSEQVLLIKNLRMTGRVLVNLSWHSSASPVVRANKTSVLKLELRSQAQKHQVKHFVGNQLSVLR